MADPGCVFFANKYLSHMSIEDQDASESYFKGFQNYTESVDFADVSVFERKIISLMNEGALERAGRYCDLIISVDGLNDHRSQVKLLTIFFLKMACLKGQPGQLLQAKEIKAIVSEIKDGDLSDTNLNKKFLRFIRKEADRLIVELTPVIQVRRNGPCYGRNEKVIVKYQDGRVEKKKYKLVEESISQGLYAVVTQ